MKKATLRSSTKAQTNSDLVPFTKKAWTKQSLLLLEFSQTNEKVPRRWDCCGRGHLKCS